MERDVYFQSNRKTRVYLNAIGDLIGRHGLAALLRLAELHAWAEELPPYTDEFAVDFVDIATLSEKLELMYGPRGGRALSLRAGRAAFKDLYEHFGETLGIAGDAFKTEPAPTRIRLLLDSLAKGMRLQGDSQITVEENEGDFVYTVEPCPECWCRTDVKDVVCHGTVGFLQQALEWAGLGDFFRVEQIACAASHPTIEDGGCAFQIAKVL